MHLAIIGTGIAGLVAARLLHGRHQVTLFEAAGHVGGHTNTVAVDLGGERHAVDTGFIVFNDRTYPHFVRLLGLLGVASQPTAMGFSVRCDRTGLEYGSASFNALFAQRRNLVRPAFWRMVRDVLRFNRTAPAVLHVGGPERRLAEYLAEGRYSREFADYFLAPLGGAIWSSPRAALDRFPVRFLVEFYRNHGMLQVFGQPQWRVIRGGSQAYVGPLTAPFRDRIRLNTPVAAVARFPDRVEVTPRGGPAERFDQVILACHSDQALSLLTDATAAEREVLGCFPYQRNEAVLHTDTALLPRNRRAWTSWNYHVTADPEAPVAVTYNMNLLQGLRSRHTFCVTLNDAGQIDPAQVIRRITYHHPQYTTRQRWAQARHHELINANRTSFCGAYWGYGFHEDGVNSALAVGKAFGVDL